MQHTDVGQIANLPRFRQVRNLPHVADFLRRAIPRYKQPPEDLCTYFNHVFPLRLGGFAPLRRNSNQTFFLLLVAPSTDVSALDSLEPD
jgi:hypothetical protein